MKRIFLLTGIVMLAGAGWLPVAANCFWGSTTVGGGGSPPPQGPNCAGGGCCEGSASPTWVKTGNFTRTAVDLTVGGPGLPLTATRTYFSQNWHVGLLGHNWQFNWEQVVLETVGGETGDQFVLVRFGNCQRWRFADQGGGVFATPPRLAMTLTKEATGFRLIKADGAVLMFDAAGQLSRMEDAQGNPLELAYDGNGGLTTVFDPRTGDVQTATRRLDFTRNLNGWVASVSDGTRTVFYDYDLNLGHLTTVTDPVGRQTIYEYTSPHPLQAHFLTKVRLYVEDAEGDVFDAPLAEISYTDQFRVSSITDAEGPAAYIYDPTTNTTEKTMGGLRSVFTYDANGWITKQEDFDKITGDLLRTQEWEYGLTPFGHQRLLRQVDPAGIVTTYTYTARGNVATRTTDPCPTPGCADHLDLSQRREYQEINGRELPALVYYTRGVNSLTPLAFWQGTGREYFLTTDAGTGAVAGQVRRQYRLRSDWTGPGDTTHRDLLNEFIYVADVTNPSFEQVAEVRDALGNISTYTYDAGTGDLLTVETPPNCEGAQPGCSSPRVQLGYDSQHRLISQIDALGYTTTFTYDAQSRLTSTTRPNPGNGATGFTSTTAYDNVVVDPAPGLAGTFLARIQTDVNGHATTQFFDQFRRLRGAQDALGQVVQYTYTATGQVATVKSANGDVMQFCYDPLDRVKEKTDFNGGMWTYQYTPAGQLVQQTDPKGQVLVFEYDPLNRLVRKRFGGANALKRHEFLYTDSGRGQQLERVEEYDEGGTWVRTTAFSYDASRRIAEIRRLEGNTPTNPTYSEPIAYAYDAEDRVESYVLDDDASTMVMYTYYPDGSVKEMRRGDPSGAQDEPVKFTYLRTGQKATVKYPHADPEFPRVERRYDDQGRLTQVENLAPGGTLISRYSYQYDFDHQVPPQPTWRGLRTMETEDLPGYTGTRRFHYDDVYQLIQTDYPDIIDGSYSPNIDNQIFIWTYDAIRNRLTQTVSVQGAETYTYYKQPVTIPAGCGVPTEGVGASSQLLKSNDDWTYRWDRNGNLCRQSKPGVTREYFWGEENRLVEIKENGATVASYQYDYAGNRVEVMENSVIRRFVYNGLDLVKEIEVPSSSGTSRYYLFGNLDKPLVQYTGASVTGYYYSDGLGSVKQFGIGVSPENTYHYSVWGEVAMRTGALPNLFEYTAREYGAADLWYYRARYYDPRIGRFSSEDIAGWNEGVNFYTYVHNLPISLVDPTGQTATGFIGGDVVCRKKPGSNRWEDVIMFVNNDTICVWGQAQRGQCGKPKCDVKYQGPQDPYASMTDTKKVDSRVVTPERINECFEKFKKIQPPDGPCWQQNPCPFQCTDFIMSLINCEKTCDTDLIKICGK